MIDAKLRYLLLIVALILNTMAQRAKSQDPLVFISAFASGDDGAIHAYQLNRVDGQLKLIQRTTDVENPFFMALSPDGQYLYSIHAPGQFGGKTHEQVAAYKIVGKTGQIDLIEPTVRPRDGGVLSGCRCDRQVRGRG